MIAPASSFQYRKPRYHEGFLSANHPILTDDELQALLNEHTPAAEEKICKTHVRMIIEIVRRFSTGHATAQDMVQEAMQTLIKCIRNHRGKAWRFRTYAYSSIRFRMMNWLRADRIVRIPRRFSDSITSLRNKLDSTTDDYAVAKQNGAKAFEIGAVRRAMSPVESMQEIEDMSAHNPSRVTQSRQDAAQIMAWVETNCSPREVRVFRQRFGLSSAGRQELCATIGKREKLTAARIQQIETKVINKTRRHFAKELD